MQNQIKQSWFFRQSQQEVWEYLTNPELIGQWLAKTDFEPLVGHKFSFSNKSGKFVDCEVLEVKPFTNLSYSWNYPSANDGNRVDSKVTWTLVPKESGTELQLVHNDFISLEDFTAHSKGWNNCLTKFEELINQTQDANANT